MPEAYADHPVRYHLSADVAALATEPQKFFPNGRRSRYIAAKLRHEAPIEHGDEMPGIATHRKLTGARIGLMEFVAAIPLGAAQCKAQSDLQIEFLAVALLGVWELRQ